MCALNLVVILMYHKRSAAVVTVRKKRYVDTLKTENECERSLFLISFLLCSTTALEDGTDREFRNVGIH